MLQLFLFCFFYYKWITVRTDFSIPQIHNTGGVLLRQLRIMSDHDHQTVFGHLLKQIHHLHTGIAVQRACRLVGQQNIRIIDQRPRDCHTLHLPAGKLIRLLMYLLSKSYFCESLNGPLSSLAFSHTGDSQCQFHIGKNCLMWYQIITLKHKTNGMIPIGIPVSVLIFFCGNPINNQITAVVPVKTANDIKKCRLTGAAGTQNCHKLIIPEI